MMKFNLLFENSYISINYVDWCSRDKKVSHVTLPILDVIKKINIIKPEYALNTQYRGLWKRVSRKEEVKEGKHVFYISRDGENIIFPGGYQFPASWIAEFLYHDKNTGDISVTTLIMTKSWRENDDTIRVSASGPWKICFTGYFKNLLLGKNFFQSQKNWRKSIYDSLDPYLSKFLKEKKIDPVIGVVCPKIELLYKADYTFAKKIIDSGEDFRMQQLRGLCKTKGTTPREVLHVPRYALSEIKKAETLDRCHFIRFVSGLHNISEKEFWWIMERYTKRNQLSMFSISDKWGRDRRLVEAFGRDLRFPYIWYLDTIEWINKKRSDKSHYYAAGIIFDYKRMCNELGIRFDKSKEYIETNHDMISEMYRKERSRIEAERERKKWEAKKEIFEKEKQFNYSDDKFLIRFVEGYEDILSEASQQHNCVASYWNSVISGWSRIFLLRRCSKPDESYVTVELGRDNRIIQAFLKGNQVIKDKETLDFLKTWRGEVIRKTKELQENGKKI